MHCAPSDAVVSAGLQLSLQHETVHIRQCGWLEASLVLEQLDSGLADFPEEINLIQ